MRSTLQAAAKGDALPARARGVFLWGLVFLTQACSSTGPGAGSAGSTSGSAAGAASSGSVSAATGAGGGGSTGAIGTGGSFSGAFAGAGALAASGTSSGSVQMSGAAQTTGAAAGSASGSAQSGASASGASGAGSAGSLYPPLVNGGPCPASALYCDDFEEYTLATDAGPLDLIEMRPNWEQFHFHGYPRVDNAKAYRGKQSAHFDTEAGSYRFAAFVRETPDAVPTVPLAHFGRVMVFLNAVSPMTQWTIIEVGGLLPGSTTEMATFGFGGNKGHLAASYTQRTRAVASDGGILLRPAGPLNATENAMAKMDCTKTALTETFTPNKWVCVEWNIDAAAGATHLWLDGALQSEVDVAGHGTECTTGTATAPWQPPATFTKLDLTWEGYGGDSPGQQSYFDEFAVGEQRIGCPP